MHDITTYEHFETGAVYTFNEIVAGISDEELAEEGYENAEFLAMAYISGDIFIEVER